MRKGLRNLAGIAALGTGITLGSGCAPGQNLLMVLDRPASEMLSDSIRYHRGNPWAGTPILNRIENPDGTIVFTLNVNRGNADYTDKMFDMSKYIRKDEAVGNGIWIVRYTPVR